MERMHVHLAVDNLEASIAFYNHLFGVSPVVRKLKYAKWHVDDMKVNFAITEQRENLGLDHLGLEVETDSELAESEERLSIAGRPMVATEDVHCCFARLQQAWTIDPQGILWESFRNEGESDLYCDGGDPVRRLREQAAAEDGDGT